MPRMTKEHAEILLKDLIDQLKLTAKEREMLLHAIKTLKGDI